RHRSRVDVRAVQDPDAVSRDAAVEAARSTRIRARLAAVRRLYADVPSPVAARRGAQVSAERGVLALLHASVVRNQLQPRAGSRRAELRGPHGSKGRRPSRPSGRSRDEAGRMLKAISRYGARVAPGSDRIVRECRRTGTLVQGPAIAAFEDAFASRLGVPRAFSASFGRMAFLYILRALNLPPGSEVIFPALTFWVVPEMARVAGLRPVFVDVDPHTLTIDPDKLERAITGHTRA